MKKIIIALAAGAAIFGTVFAFAATLNVSSNDLGAGDTVVAACNGSATGSVTYHTTYSGTAGGYVVDQVTVKNLAAACNGETASATLTGSAGGASIGDGSGTVAAGVATFSVSPTPLASAVNHIYVVVTGTGTVN